MRPGLSGPPWTGSPSSVNRPSTGPPGGCVSGGRRQGGRGMGRRRRLTEAEIDKALQAAKNSVSTEGLTITAEDEQLIKARLRREITDAEFIRLAKESAQAVKDGPPGPPA